MAKPIRTYAYIDGFNLYYRAVKDTPYKWLNILTLLKSVLKPDNRIDKIRYFTAGVSGRRDSDAPRRQQLYLRALATIPQLSVHKGRFLVSQKWAKIANPPNNFVRPDPVTVAIVNTEEKGSDVNLASYLLLDGFKNRFDVAVVLSNDTDLVEPIRMVYDEIHKPVGLICPTNQPAKSLKKVATFVRHVTEHRLAGAQFPDSIPGTTIRKPITW